MELEDVNRLRDASLSMFNSAYRHGSDDCRDILTKYKTR